MYLLAETFARHLFFNLDKNNEDLVHINVSNNEIIENEISSHVTNENGINDENDSDEDNNEIFCDDDYTKVIDADCIKKSTENSSSTSEKSIHSTHKTSEKNNILMSQIMHNNDNHNLLKTNENISLSPDDNSEGIYNKWDMLGSKSQRRLFRQLFVVSLVLWLAWLASTSIQQTSRRLANIAFVSLVLALSFTLILLIAIVDSIGDLVVVYRGKKRKNISVPVPVGLSGVTPVQPVPVKTLECLNTMQLPVFLAANVCTGVINMSMKTIYVSHVNSLMVLFVYSLSIAGISWVLMKKI